MPYETGSSTAFSSTALKIMQAQSQQSLRLRSDEELKQSLRYAMILVGLRASNMPTEEEKFVLLNFIRSNFGNLTPEEVKLAFEYAVAGRFKIDAKCYENFSCEYFGRIVNAYINYSMEETKVLKNKVNELEPLPVPPMEVLKEQAIQTANMYAHQLRKNPDFKWIYGGLNHLFDILISSGIFEEKEPDAINDKSKAYKDFINFMVVNNFYLDKNGKFDNDVW